MSDSDLEMVHLDEENGKNQDSQQLLAKKSDSETSIDKPKSRPRVNFALDSDQDADDDDGDERDPESQLTSKQKQKQKQKQKHRRRNMRSRGTPLEYRKPRNREPKFVKYIIILAIPALMLISLFAVIQQSPTHAKETSPGAAPTGSVYPSGFNMKNNWGSYSPYFDSGALFEGIERNAETGVYGLPDRCRFKQVHVLHRHAERLPTSGTGRQMEEVASKLKKMKEPPVSPLGWIQNWTYNLGTALLVPEGVGTEFQAGSNFWASHGRMLFNATERHLMFYDKGLNVYPNGTKRPIPVLRATTQSRIETSARAWAAGFFGVYGGQSKSPEDNDDLYKLVLIPEMKGYNNTLAPYLACDNYKKSKNNSSAEHNGRAHEEKWVNSYLVDATKRLQKLLPGYKGLKPMDVYQMQKICTFEHAAYGYSGFCELFTETEWRGFEYAADLKFYGTSSFGSPVGPASGTGWLSELLARLERRYITEPQYGVNTTYTSDEELFPLDQLFYLDMSHDATIVSVLSALGLDIFNKDLPPTRIPVPRQFIISRLTPFGARLFVEVLECGEGTGNTSVDDDDQVRLKLNNRILPLGSLRYCPKSKDGLCPMKKFIKSLHYALEQIDYEEICEAPLQEAVDPESEQQS